MGIIKYDYIPVNGVTRPGIKRTSTAGLIMHYTANNGGTAQNHHDYFARAMDYASAQIFVDDYEVICIIPLDEVSYHANDIQRYNADGTPFYPMRGILGNANYSCLSLEMCLDRNGNITEKTFNNAVKTVKELVTLYPQITPNTIWRHFDVTGKNCPAPWVARPSELTRFINAVFSDTVEPAPKEEQPKEEEYDMTEFAFAYGSAMYYVTGSRMVALQSSTEWSVIQAMYQQTHNGKKILGLDWTNNKPTAMAYFGICDYGDDAKFQSAITKDLGEIKSTLKK